MRNVKFNAIKRQDGLVVGTEKEQLEGFFHEWGTMELKNEEGRKEKSWDFILTIAKVFRCQIVLLV